MHHAASRTPWPPFSVPKYPGGEWPLAARGGWPPPSPDRPRTAAHPFIRSPNIPGVNCPAPARGKRGLAPSNRRRSAARAQPTGKARGGTPLRFTTGGTPLRFTTDGTPLRLKPGYPKGPGRRSSVKSTLASTFPTPGSVMIRRLSTRSKSAMSRATTRKR
jgi:hypothetical protein